MKKAFWLAGLCACYAESSNERSLTAFSKSSLLLHESTVQHPIASLDQANCFEPTQFRGLALAWVIWADYGLLLDDFPGLQAEVAANSGHNDGQESKQFEKFTSIDRWLVANAAILDEHVAKNLSRDLFRFDNPAVHRGCRQRELWFQNEPQPRGRVATVEVGSAPEIGRVLDLKSIGPSQTISTFDQRQRTGFVDIDSAMREIVWSQIFQRIAQAEWDRRQARKKTLGAHEKCKPTAASTLSPPGSVQNYALLLADLGEDPHVLHPGLPNEGALILVRQANHRREDGTCLEPKRFAELQQVMKAMANRYGFSVYGGAYEEVPGAEVEAHWDVTSSCHTIDFETWTLPLWPDADETQRVLASHELTHDLNEQISQLVEQVIPLKNNIVYASQFGFHSDNLEHAVTSLRVQFHDRVAAILDHVERALAANQP